MTILLFNHNVVVCYKCICGLLVFLYGFTFNNTVSALYLIKSRLKVNIHKYITKHNNDSSSIRLTFSPTSNKPTAFPKIIFDTYSTIK